MRTFDPVVITPLSDDLILEPYCEAWCGSTLNEIVGRLNGEMLCSVCYEESKTRSFAIEALGDMLCDKLPSIASAMVEIATYLDDPDQWARYAPFKITAYNDVFLLREVICEINVPADQTTRSLELAGW